MKRMAASNVLIVGLDGLGVEIGAHAETLCLGRRSGRKFSQEHHPGGGQISDRL